MSYHLEKYLFFKNVLLQNNQYGGGFFDNFLKKTIIEDSNDKKFIKDSFPEELNKYLESDYFKKVMKDKTIIKMNTTNTLYRAEKNEILIYGASIFNHKIIYVSLENGIQYSIILNIDNNYSNFFNEIKEYKDQIKKVILKKIKKEDKELINISLQIYNYKSLLIINEKILNKLYNDYEKKENVEEDKYIKNNEKEEEKIKKNIQKNNVEIIIEDIIIKQVNVNINLKKITDGSNEQLIAISDNFLFRDQKYEQ